jgi:hypothetical protein
MRNAVVSTSMFLILLATACNPGYLKPVERPPATVAEQNYKTLWDSAIAVVKDFGFRPEYQDQRGGLLTTYAVLSGHLLEETWHRDHSSLRDIRENSIQNILRAVRVRFHRIDDDRFDVTVEVAKARSNLPEPQVTDSSEMISLNWATPGLPQRLVFEDLTKKTRHSPGSDPIVVPLGRDRPLAETIQAEIRITAGLPASGYLAPDREAQTRIPATASGETK